MRDLLGLAASCLCLAHCVALPVMTASGAIYVSMEVFGGEMMHYLLTALILLLALLSFPSSFKLHRQPMPMLLALIGIVSIIAAFTFGTQYELFCLFISALSMICAHGLNRRLLGTEHGADNRDNVLAHTVR